MLDEQLFYKLVKQLKDKHPKLKFKIYKAKFIPCGVSGSYIDNCIEIAIGTSEWKWIIGILAHEYSHYLRDNGKSGNFDANTVLYSKSSPIELKIKAARIVILDEYFTDCRAFEVLRTWGIAKHYPDWFEDANKYSTIIKYLLNTGKFINDKYGRLKSPNKKLSQKEVVKPLSAATLDKLNKMVKAKKLTILIENYEDVVKNV